ncbi:MAG: bifunctional DNA-formamidopyrimidine glycosylase/DNA-(apurinic or apyrimidinic site) lyase [Pirellulales bacterium]|nr:bifunctional DNA-formamidopyrimidine glycosylase/DNA-(apurinic or apyrimidinic site) lyase [Pirellulales bacterium]
MPELPEVETMRRGLLPIAGSRIVGLRRPPSRLRPIQVYPRVRDFRRRIVGRTISAVERLGKRIVVRLDSGDRIVIEPRMTGRVLLSDPPNRSHMRLVIDLQGESARRVVFWDVRGLGVVQLLSAAEFREHLGSEKIGPDALEITTEQLRGRLEKSRRAIKVALLDQRAVAGIGNLYASEILHRAGIHPELTCDRLRPQQWAGLRSAVAEVLGEAIICQGSTLSDGTYRTPADQAGGYQERHQVYQRAGQPCLRCGRKTIVRLVQVQRSTFFCPACQPRKR